MSEGVSIWGTGSAGRRIYAYLKIRTEIVCFYDSDESKIGTLIEGVPVKKWEPADSSSFIVIASSYYKEIIPLLVEEGLEIFKDFTLYQFIENPYYIEYSLLYSVQQCMGGWNDKDWIRYKSDKKMVVIHGGCHAEALGNLLASHTQFRERYKVVIAPHIMSMLLNQPKIIMEIAEHYIENEFFWNATDIFFYQLSHIWPGLIDPKTLLPKLSEDCKRYALSPLEFLGYFSQCREQIYKIATSYTDVNLAYLPSFSDRYIEKFYRQGKTVEEINAIINDLEFLPSDEVLEFFRVAISLLQTAEDDADVKIYDYIEAHGRERQLFYDPSHPAPEVLLEYAGRIVRLLIPECEPLSQDGYYRDFHNMYPAVPQTFVYPCVRKALGLKSYYKRAGITSPNIAPVKFLTNDEYIREYVRILAYNEKQEEKKVKGNRNG
ncbi:MAG: hypothetical protein HFH72_08465 [Lachnospiraceae bacterium]|nr:hypothetical protein [Lachnospiraceae bacterium]